MLGRGFDPRHIPDEVQVIKGLTLDSDYIRVAQTIHVDDFIERFAGPVLLIHGDADDTVPIQESIRAARMYPKCRLEILPGETHHFDQNPERMKAVIRDWLS